MRGRGADRLYEREHELAVARAAVTAAAGGEGRVLLVEGPPGIGKTRLLESIVEMADHAGLKVDRARGDELETDFAYGVLRQLLAGSLAQLDPSLRAVVLEGPVSALASIVEGTGEHRAASREDEALNAAHGLYRLMQDLADRQPRAFCVDDAHWADPASLEALGYLARRLDDLPVLMAMAHRGPLDGLVGDHLRRFSSVTGTGQLTPSPLSEAAVAGLAEAALEGELQPGFPSRLWRSTGGNPFLVRELLTELTAGGPAWEESGDLDIERLIPAPVTQSVLRRVTAAGRAGPALADAFAVLGEATLADAAALAEVDEDGAVAAADRLFAADVLSPGPRLRFTHPILREAVRGHIPPLGWPWRTRAPRGCWPTEGLPSSRSQRICWKGLPRGDAWAVETLLTAAEADARVSYDLVLGAGSSWRTPYARAPLADALLARGELDEAERMLADPEPEEQAEDSSPWRRTRGSGSPGSGSRPFAR